MVCDEISDLELSGFNNQNVLFEIVLSSSDEGFLRMDLHGIYGSRALSFARRFTYSMQASDGTLPEARYAPVRKSLAPALRSPRG